MIVKERTVRVYDTDSAGLIFYANIFRFAHAVLEEFFKMVGTPIKEIFDKYEMMPVAIKAQAEYLKPIRLGTQLTIQLSVKRITKSTFTLKYDFFNENSDHVAIVINKHATISTETGSSIRIPIELFSQLKKHLVQTN